MKRMRSSDVLPNAWHLSVIASWEHRSYSIGMNPIMLFYRPV